MSGGDNEDGEIGRKGAVQIRRRQNLGIFGPSPSSTPCYCPIHTTHQYMLLSNFGLPSPPPSVDVLCEWPLRGKQGRSSRPLPLIPSPISPARSFSRSSMVAHSIKSDNLEGGREESREGGRGEGERSGSPGSQMNQQK